MFVIILNGGINVTKGIDLMPQRSVVIQLGDTGHSLSYVGARPWALLEAHFGGPLLTVTIPTVFDKIAQGTVSDVLYIAWCGLQHLGDGAPDIEQVQRANILDLLVGDQGVADGPLLTALLQSLPKTKAPNPEEVRKLADKSGIGSFVTTLRRWFSGGR